MRLERIKLAGFKSFVDPTTIEFPSNLVGVVGPNGCGKSNVIDAVRWVMGESSAGKLRGESITDVIFNGSIERKPVGQASVELVFENAAGRLSNEYAQYNQISIKRIVNREAQSTYMLNGTRCRRKDVISVFLGTGLGPRSYSIIEQGMISRLIEAKPEELRTHLEEVSGISKYKERRRETQNRIKHTRENLSRLSDLREEIEKQLEKLKRQSRSAERYKVLKEEEHLFRAQSHALRWQTLNVQNERDEEKLQAFTTQLAALHAEHQHIETEVTKLRESKHDVTERYNEIQSQYYGIGADITRIEQAMQHFRERQGQLKDDCQQAEADWAQAVQHLTADKARATQLTDELQTIDPQRAEAQSKAEASKALLDGAEAGMQAWQTEWDEFNHRAANVAQTAQVEQTRIQHIEQQQHSSKQRLEKLVEEHSQLDLTSPQQECEDIQANLEQSERACEQHQAALTTTIETIEQDRANLRTVTDELDDAKDQLQTLTGRKASLETLQQEALEQNDKAMEAWLSEHDLSHVSKLAQVITVEDGWETAVETVLGHFVQSLCVDNIAALCQDLSTLEQGTVTLFDSNANVVAPASKSYPRLSDKVQGPTALMAMFESVYLADTLDDANRIRADLSVHESVVMRTGCWFGKAWAHVAREKNVKFGVIQRERELKEMTAQVVTLKQAVLAQQTALDNATMQLESLETKRTEQQQGLQQQLSAKAELAAQLRVKQAGIEQLKRRSCSVEGEIEELRTQLMSAGSELDQARSTWQEAMGNMEEDANARERLLSQRDQSRKTLEQAREQSRNDRDNAHQLRARFQSLESQNTLLLQSMERLETREAQAKARVEQLREALSHGESPLENMQKDLDAALHKRVAVEGELNEVKARLDESDHKLSTLEERRHQVDRETEGMRDKVEQSRLKNQEIKVRCKTLQEQLAESDQVLEDVIQNLPEEATESMMQEQLERTINRINRLGPINLAAIDEFQVESERKEYLDKQNADLEEALAVLEDVIQKIDKETRQRFKETYSTVNEHFKTYFPKIFGGGSAELELTGEDLLDTGVTVMARPPGKKNSTIHLLSGGEKALTAIALVFSIFQVNPAPFCMLDEVDAPLDDANVVRYCKLVKEMSDKVQFIFISHNKIAIEMGQHLAGVTMNEPGASRIVSVDMDQAVAMAEA